MKHFFDFGALTITLGTMFSWLPHITALLALIWMIFRVWEGYLNVQIKKANLKGMRCASCPEYEENEFCE